MVPLHRRGGLRQQDREGTNKIIIFLHKYIFCRNPPRPAGPPLHGRGIFNSRLILVPHPKSRRSDSVDGRGGELLKTPTIVGVCI